MVIKICLAGATGWAGECIARAILNSPDLKLSGAMARKTAGQDIGQILGLGRTGVKISTTIEEALQAPTDVLVDYTKPEVVKDNVLTALKHGISVVIGTSGLTSEDYDQIDAEAKSRSLGVISAGNFSITAALAKRFSLLAAQHLPQWEIIDYAHADKPDVPSGTTRELAEQLALVRKNKLGKPINELHGPQEARGADIAGTPVHSIRLPSYVNAFETIFGLPDERLTIRHDAGAGAQPYVNGTLLAIRIVLHTKGLTRGLDNLLFNSAAP